jgi:hypothetical protein
MPIRPVKQKKKGLVPGLLGALGAAAGNVFGGPALGKLGQKAGDYLGSISGMGDYQVSQNSILSNPNGPPTFRTDGSGSIMISHREFIGNVSGSEEFELQSWNFNPGLRELFPWASAIAQRYEQYIPRGAVVEFKSTSATALNSTNTALGTVILSTNYDVTDPVFSSKMQMTNYEFTTTCKPSESMLHPIECDPAKNFAEMLYTRSGPVDDGTDLRFNDLGRVQLATEGMQASAIIGELWISYEIELVRPKLPNPLGDGINSCHYQGFDVSAASPSAWGSPLTRVIGSNLPITVNDDDELVFPYVGRYRVVVQSFAASDATATGGQFNGLAGNPYGQLVPNVYFDSTTGENTAYYSNYNPANGLVKYCAFTVDITYNFQPLFEVYPDYTSTSATRNGLYDHNVFIDMIPSQLSLEPEAPLVRTNKRITELETMIREMSMGVKPVSEARHARPPPHPSVLPGSWDKTTGNARPPTKGKSTKGPHTPVNSPSSTLSPIPEDYALPAIPGFRAGAKSVCMT